MKEKKIFQKNFFICSVLIVMCLMSAPFEKTNAYVRPQIVVEQGSPIQSTKYPQGTDVILDFDDFVSDGSFEQYYEARGFDTGNVSKDEVYANAYTTVFPSLVLKADLGGYDNPIRSFVVKGSEIYIGQEYDSIEFNGNHYTGANVLLSRCKIKGDSFSRKDSMLLTNVGNAATMETYKYAGELYFLLGCGSLKIGESICFSSELGRIKYKPGTVIDSEEIEKFTDFTVEDPDDSVKYIESALSSDKKRMIVHKRSFYGKDTFSVYDFTKTNDILSSSENREVSVKNNKEFKDALLFEFSDPKGMPISVKGIDLSNEKDGMFSIYLSSGNDSFDDRLLKLFRYDSNGELQGQLIVSDLGLNSVWGEDFQYYPSSEINGLKISGKSLMFAFRDLNNNKHQLILSVQKETMKKEGQFNGIVKNKNNEDTSNITYTLRRGTLTISGEGPMNRVFAKDSRIKKVVIEKGITVIPENAFWGCENLKSVVLPKGGRLRCIESGAFAYTSIIEIDIPESVSVMGYGAIETGTLKSISLPCDTFVYTATGKASENFPCTIGTGVGCTISFKRDPESTNVMGFLVAEKIFIGEYDITG